MIDTSNFIYKDSVWQDIFNCLKTSGFEVYSPGTKIGECTSPYIVLKNDGSTRYEGISSDIDLYAVMCYVPRDRYSMLEPMVQSVKRTLKNLAPFITPYGVQTSSFYDDSYKAHMVSISYKNYKKML